MRGRLGAREGSGKRMSGWMEGYCHRRGELLLGGGKLFTFLLAVTFYHRQLLALGIKLLLFLRQLRLQAFNNSSFFLNLLIQGT